MDTEKNIIIADGGFAGTSFAKACRGRLPSGYRLTMVYKESYTTFNPMLPEDEVGVLVAKHRPPAARVATCAGHAGAAVAVQRGHADVTRLERERGHCLTGHWRRCANSQRTGQPRTTTHALS